jgi:hypothetical protein
MESLEGLHNELVIGAYEILTSPQSLDAAAKAFDSAKGSTRTRLAAALAAAAEAQLEPVEQVTLPEDLDRLTVVELKKVAARNRVFAYSSPRKDELIRAIRADFNQRRRLSRLTPPDVPLGKH